MSADDDSAEGEWTTFNRSALGRPPRELLRRAIGLAALTGTRTGVAVDLGCGSGADTLELLRQGWTVHAVDADGPSLRLLAQQVPAEARERLHLHEAAFQDFVLPRCDLVWAGFSLPFCPAAAWPGLWPAIVDALAPGGRFAGDLFGERHAFGAYDDVMLLGEARVRKLLAALEVEAFDIEDGVRPSGGQVTRWHAFGIIARKPVGNAAEAAAA
ncbi:MAG: class I SAM-dependent methyltransferase [Rubrivivax sp.]|nr:class I SAM-dependent methyltransferase [Rubrivivax sp.]